MFSAGHDATRIWSLCLCSSAHAGANPEVATEEGRGIRQRRGGRPSKTPCVADRSARFRGGNNRGNPGLLKRHNGAHLVVIRENMIQKICVPVWRVWPWVDA